MKKIYILFILFIAQFAFAQSDCVSNIPICGNSGISYTPSGNGNSQDIPTGGDSSNCLYTEHFSVWYSFTVATAGTLTFNIVPNVASTDYDWAVWGPNKACGNLGSPIRCNYSGTSGNTGLNMTNTNTFSNAGGSPFCKYLDVLPGETYILIVDNFVSSTNGFSMTWGGTATLASPFNDPTIQPYPFNPIGIPGATAADPRIVEVCDIAPPYNFQSHSANILNGNANFYVKYYRTTNDALADTNAITAPTVVNTTATYYYTVRFLDPNNPDNPANKCFNVNAFKFKDVTFRATNATITECNNNNSGVATYNLTTANVYTPNPVYTYTVKYYPTVADANAGTNEITNPLVYTSAAGDVFAKITTNLGCSDIGKITLKFYADIAVLTGNLETCYLENNPSTGLFDLTKPIVTTAAGTTKEYYPSETDAVNSTNPIPNPAAYISPSGTVYVKVIDGNGCYKVTKIFLKVTPPAYSDILKDKQICVEGTTTLDAGPGFTEYLWSNGQTSSFITGVTVGTYYVRLKKGNCWTKQEVKVLPVELPVISNVNIGPNSISADVIGGHPPYVYSMDNQNWQDSNTFPNLPRGTYTIYVKDSFNCLPVQVEVTVPNIVNVITPNGDGVNDVVDYSALSRKKDLVFAVYDRYGSKIYQADKDNGYKWDGTILGKKLSTGTYWYSVSWKENDKLNTPVIYSGWILLKNRE